MIELIKRIYDLSYKYQLGHLSSCLTALPIIKDIYERKASKDIFTLSEGHAGLAWYVVLERYGFAHAESLLLKHGTHPSTDPSHGILFSSGSLGHGLPIAVGLALARQEIRVHCLVSDGEAAEGSIYEALNIIREQNICNIHIYVNANGYGAYKRTEPKILQEVMTAALRYHTYQLHFYNTNPLLEFPYLHGLVGHYHRLTKEEYTDFLRRYNEKVICFLPTE